jgi:hypothetical protein
MTTIINRSEIAARLAQTMSDVPVTQLDEAVRILAHNLAESLPED